MICTHIMKHKRPQSLHSSAKRRHVSNNKNEMNCGRVKGWKPPQAYQRLQCGRPDDLLRSWRVKMAYWGEKNIIIRFILVLYICVSNQAWGQEGWILALLWNTVTKDAKKGNEPIVSHLDPNKLGWMVGFFLWHTHFFSCVTKRMIPSCQDRPISTSRVAN